MKECAMAATSPADAVFAARWITDELPACPAGLTLLRQLSETKSHLFAVAERAGFTDPDDLELTADPLWKAFVAHYAGCDDCNEV